MRKRFGCLVIVVCTFCTVHTTLAASGPLDSRAIIQADYDHIYTAVRHKDLSRAMRYFTTDFQGEDDVNLPKNMTPPMDLTQLRQCAANYVQAIQTITGHAVVKRLVISGNQATATVMHHVVIVGTPDPRTGKRFHGVFDATTRDTWKQGPLGWRMQRGRGLSLRVERHAD